MDHVAVIFSNSGAHIFHGINPNDYRGRMDVLIDPKFPPGIPPHLWKLHPNGYIESVPDTSKRPSRVKFVHLVVALSMSSVLNLIFIWLLHHAHK